MVLSCLIPSAVFADTTNEEITTELAENIGTAEPTRSAEITSMREKNAKTYEMSDGSYQCVVYAEDIHYEDSR